MVFDKSDETQLSTASPTTVLIADDDPPTRILLRAAITQWGYKVVAAQDGEEAWDILQHPDAPKLLIIDWLMPKLNGIDLCIRIKKQLSYRPYIILLTQVTGTENIVKGLEAGANEFLSKPFNMAELNSRLSVGERIIHFEDTLATQNKKLQGYIQQIKSLTALSPTISAEINEILKSANLLEKTDNNLIHINKIKELHSNLKQVADLIDKFHLNE